MSWISPNSHNDVSGKWADEANAYDGDIETSAYQEPWHYGYYLELTLSSAINCDKIRVYGCIGASTDYDLGLDVYYDGAWHNLSGYGDMYSANQWVEKNVAGGAVKLVSKARMHTYPKGDRFYLKEFEFNKIQAARPLVGGSLVSGNSLIGKGLV